MLIPNVRLDILGTNAAGASVLCPPYAVALYKAKWGNRLDAEKGITVSNVAFGWPDRYREIGSAEEEERLWATKFGYELFSRVYPNGLREEIEKVLMADANERNAAAARAAAPMLPHPSFLEAGCDEKQAVALQVAGMHTLAEVPEDFMRVAGVPGVTPDLAVALINAAKALRTPVLTAPVAQAPASTTTTTRRRALPAAPVVETPAPAEVPQEAVASSTPE